LSLINVIHDAQTSNHSNVPEDISIMKIFKPTHLYIKQHSITGLKYFGKTTQDLSKYHGSGTRWNNHLKVHGYEHVVTLWSQLFTTVDEIKEFALNFSEENQIVESKEWANLKPENGLDGGWLYPGLGGGDASQMRTPEVLAKNIERFGPRGTAELLLSPESRAKAQETYIRNHGSLGACFSTTESIEKRNATNLKLHGNRCAANKDPRSRLKSQETQRKLRTRPIVDTLRELGKIKETQLGRCWFLKPDNWINSKIKELESI